MKYIFSYTSPHRHFIDIECIVDKILTDEITICLPAWRPGRYELGNFAKNIQSWKAYDAKGNQLKHQKVNKDTWKVQCKGAEQVHIKYNYYGAELNAGSTYLDEKQLYVNPVNCCLYMPDRIAESCEVELKVPENYKVACSLNKKGKHTLMASDFHELADSPFIASAGLQRNLFVMDGVEYNLWFQGDCEPIWPRLINDFFIFINEQIMMMKEVPTDNYHFLFQVLPVKFYHGVEHLKSTVIALGPGHKIMSQDVYNELLGICSHELFHAWNIKSIRPAEMMPYDYSKENYSRLGYVCEGVTTYYGDYFLFRSGVFSELDYFKTFQERLNKHFHNPARLTMPVTEASFDTWLDGYVQGIPNRKTSIYDEGCLLAFMTEIFIRKNTANAKCLDDVMRYLYTEFAKKGTGYTEDDYMTVVEQMAGASLSKFFMDHVYGCKNYEPTLKECLNYIGCELESVPAKKNYESFYGLKLHEGTNKVSQVYPGSVADKAGISVNDDIISLNNMVIKNDLADWSKHFAIQKQLKMGIASNGYLKEVELSTSGDQYYRNYFVQKNVKASDEQKKNFKAWCKRDF